MNVHEVIEDLVEPYLADGLEPGEREAVEKHVDSCEACASALADAREFSNFVSVALEPMRPPADLESKILTELRGEGLRKRPAHAPKAFRFPRWAAAAVIVLGLFIVGILAQHGGELSLSRSLRGPHAEPPADPAMPSENAAVTLSAGMDMDFAYRDKEAYQYTSTASDSIRLMKEDFKARGLVRGEPLAGSMARAEEERKEGREADKTRVSREMIMVERNLDPNEFPVALDVPFATVTPVPPLSPAELERKIVKNARLDFEVDSFENAYKRVVAIAREEGGFVANSSTTKLPNGKVRGQVTVRAPAANFDNVTLKLRALGDLKNQNISTQDVTKQYVDLASKLKSKNALEARLLKLLEEGKGPVKELLQVEKELGRLREEIDAVQGELKYLENIVSLSTITLNLAERDIEQPFEYVKTVSANVGVVADDAREAFNKAHDIVKEAKGQILDARMTRDKNDAATATIRAAVDADKFPAVLEQMKELGKVTEATVNHEQRPVGGNRTKAAPDAPVRKEQAHIELTITTPIEVVTVVGEFAVEAGDAGAAYEAARKAIKEAGGTILGGKMSHQVDSSGGYVNAKIEAARFSSLAEALKKLGDVKVASVNQNDPPENAKIRTEMGTLQFRVVTPRVLIESGEGIGAMLRDTIEWGFKGILWSLKAIIVGLAYVGPWALIALLVIWLVRRARGRHVSA